MKLKYNFVMNDVAGKKVAVAVGDDLTRFNGFVKMNDTGAFIFNMLKNDVTKEDITNAILNEYSGVTKEDAEKTVSNFLGQLKQSGVID